MARAFKITSNSWEYTGDGQSLSYHSGADLIDMEFVQFHPTGMVWPPSVRGILVTEGVRGEGGILKNNKGRRFMFDDIPDNTNASTSDNPEEGWRYVTKAIANARRPPELLTRDHVARCIFAKVKEGRGSPHGGVFLDIAWIKEKIPNGEAHIKKKLPSMYHQFKELAGIDITKEPMEVGPTTHYVMGGIRVDGDTQMSTVPGSVCRRRMCGRTSRRQSTGWQLALRPVVFGKLAGEHAAKFAKENAAVSIDPRGCRSGSAGSARNHLMRVVPQDPGGPYQIQYDLQDMMQAKVGIVRTESEMQEAIAGIEKLKRPCRQRLAQSAIGNTTLAGIRHWI